jgi:hypothetical protein
LIGKAKGPALGGTRRVRETLVLAEDGNKDMSSNTTIKRIGKKLRDQSSDIVHAGLPDRLDTLLRQLSSLDSGENTPSQDRRWCSKC